MELITICELIGSRENNAWQRLDTLKDGCPENRCFFLLYLELNKFGNNEDYNRAIKVAKKSKC